MLGYDVTHELSDVPQILPRLPSSFCRYSPALRLDHAEPLYSSV